jgi:hypothetical protein
LLATSGDTNLAIDRVDRHGRLGLVRDALKPA